MVDARIMEKDWLENKSEVMEMQCVECKEQTKDRVTYKGKVYALCPHCVLTNMLDHWE